MTPNGRGGNGTNGRNGRNGKNGNGNGRKLLILIDLNSIEPLMP